MVLDVIASAGGRGLEAKLVSEMLDATVDGTPVDIPAETKDGLRTCCPSALSSSVWLVRDFDDVLWFKVCWSAAAGAGTIVEPWFGAVGVRPKSTPSPCSCPPNGNSSLSGLVVWGISMTSVALLRGVEMGVGRDEPEWTERDRDSERGRLSRGELDRWMLPGIDGCFWSSSPSAVRTTFGFGFALEIVRPRGMLLTSDKVRARVCPSMLLEGERVPFDFTNLERKFGAMLSRSSSMWSSTIKTTLGSLWKEVL